MVEKRRRMQGKGGLLTGEDVRTVRPNYCAVLWIIAVGHEQFWRPRGRAVFQRKDAKEQRAFPLNRWEWIFTEGNEENKAGWVELP